MNISAYITPEIIILVMFLWNIYLNYRIGKIKNYQQYLYTLCKTFGVFDKLKYQKSKIKYENSGTDILGEIVAEIKK